MKFILTNAFSINMLKAEGHNLAFRPIEVEGVKNLLRNEWWESAVGHEDTAAVISGLLEVEVSANRTNVQLIDGETSLIVAQYTGPRLAEGATELSEGAMIQFWQVYHYW